MTLDWEFLRVHTVKIFKTWTSERLDIEKNILKNYHVKTAACRTFAFSRK